MAQGTRSSKPDNLSGVWRSHYRYTSKSRGGEVDSEHLVQIYHKGRALIIESIPGKNKSYLHMRLSLDDNIATGSWHEETDPHGYYKGTIYYGAIQLMVDDNHEFMRGRWVGFDKQMDVDTGPWDMTYLGPTLPEGLSLI